MPRANRHFLPGHIWHITINAAARSNRSSRSIATLRSRRFNFHIDPTTRPATSFAVAFGSQEVVRFIGAHYVVTSNHLHLLRKDAGRTLSRKVRPNRQWVEQALENGRTARDDRWSEAIAVGSLTFVENVKSALGIKVMHREFEQIGGAYALREPGEPYAGDSRSESDALRLEKIIWWDDNAETAEL